MTITDSIPREALADLFWITGGPCAGKITVAEILSRTHGFAVFSRQDLRLPGSSGPREIPAMQYPRPRIDWE
jgi:hypothetical protein